MKYYRYVILLCCFGGILFAQQYFPLCTYHCKDSTWFKGAGKDSLGLNMIGFDEPTNKDGILAKLNAAYSESLDVIVRHATKSGIGRNDLEWYVRLHHGQWEAEDSSSYLETCWNGVVVPDSFALNDTAFVAFVDSMNPCRMLKTKSDRSRQYNMYKWFNMISHLKIDSLSMDTLAQDIPVCSLFITKSGDTALATRVLTVGDFSQVNQYDTCILGVNFYYPDRNLYYGIYWFDNCNLWCDQIEAKDKWIDSLKAGDYNTILDDITEIYDDHPALAYYYLSDEPTLSYFSSNAYVMWFLNYYDHKPGIQTTSYYGPDWYKTYVDSVHPNVLLINYYPLKGDSSSGGPTPEDSGALFQEALDNLCDVLGKARAEAKQVTPNPIPFWFVCQSFGQFTSNSTAKSRQPTPRELKNMIWLALTYGAKGIDHFLYPCIPENWWVDSGLVHNDGSPRDSLWIPAKEMNFIIRDIGSKLLTLESDTVFKHSGGTPFDYYITCVSSDDTVQIGTFHNTDNDTFFIVVNRLCQASDSDTVIIEIRSDSLFLVDLYTNASISPDSESNGNSYFSILLPPAQGRFFQLIPFAQDFKINKNQAYTNMPYVVLNTKAWPSEDIDSMIIRQQYGDSLIESTDWIPYDTAYCWYLCQGQGTNTVYIMYKMRGSIMTPEYYADAIMYDKTPPTYSFLINDDSVFTNTSDVTLKSSLTDASSGPSKMRYGNKFLKNLVKNSGFDSTDNWEYDTAIYHSDLDLFEIPVQTTGNYFYQSIPPESLSGFDNDTMLLWIDLVSDTFVGTGRVEFQYIYGDTAVRHEHPIGCSISIPQGTNAKVSHYNLYSYFMFQPDSDSVFTEVRVGVFIDTHSVVDNRGRLFIDNLRLDVVGSPNDYTRFENYDSLKEWTLTSGNGVRKVYGQFADGAGNETGVLFDSIIVDTTRPAAHISSPEDKQKISGNVGITGWAYDYADPEQHFKLYELKYQEYEGADTSWYGIHSESLFYTPKNPSIPPQTLGQWNTQEVTDNHGNGWYYLKLTVRDSAANYQDDTIRVNIDNPIGRDGEISGFSHDVYGLAAQDEIYIGEIGTGKIYRYNTNYQMIDTFNLIDSVGIGFPLAMAIDDSGKLWASNITSHLINRFTPQGNLLLQFGSGFSLPSGIGFDNSGNIWVSDRMHNKIKRFDQDGNLLFQFGTRGSEYGEIKRPIGIALLNDKIYIADSRNNRISVFDTLGDFIRVIGESAGLLMPFGLTVDSTGCLFVSDFIGDRVIEFGPSGNQLLEIDSILDAPSGLALSQDANVLYVSDTKHRQVLAFEVRSEPQGGGGTQSNSNIYINRLMFDVYPSIFSEQLNIRLQGIGAKSEVQLNIYDVTGRLVKSFSLPASDFPLPTSIVWHGEDNKGRQLSCGVYFIRLTVSPVGAIGPVGETSDYIETKKAILLK